MSAGAELATRDAFEALVACAGAITGFSREAILPDAIRRLVQQELSRGSTPDDLVRRANGRETGLVRLLQQAVSVGETYFFRHPEQFELVSHLVAGRRAGGATTQVRAWSAGCATGEETWSLAACLRGSVPAGTPIEVLGTDLLERNVAGAKAGVYGKWSVRTSGPMLHPVVEPAGAEKVRVIDELRSFVRFHSHNLLAPPPTEEGGFEVVFCRNVLVYFSPSASRAVVANLASTLIPGGIVIFGPMDLPEPPPGLVREGPPELQAFRRPLPYEELAPKPKVISFPVPPPKPVIANPAKPLPAPTRAPEPVVAKPAPAKVAAAKVEPVAVHLKALALIDRGQDREAAALLDTLNQDAPEYVPGLTERALLHVRQGSFAQAAELMRAVLKLTATLDDEQLLAAPEPMPVHFYAGSAEAFLESRERR